MKSPACLKWLLPALTLLSAAGCQPRDGRPATYQRQLLQTSFEAMPGARQEGQLTPTAEKAHTGRLALRLDTLQEEAAAYQAQLGALCTHRPRRFTVGAWVWAPVFGGDAALVLAITNPGDSVPALRERMYLADTGPFGQWRQVRQDVNLPTNISSGSRLTLSFAGTPADGKPLYVDDLYLTELW